MNKPDFRYYLITDRKQLPDRPLNTVIEEACRSGIKAVQLREKDLPVKALYERAEEMREITRTYNTRLFINDRVDIALAVGADGVHCRETSIRPSDVRELSSGLMIGASVHSLESAVKAGRDGADFLLYGPVFYTPSKKEYGDPQGVEQLAEIIKRVALPVFAVGGVSPERAGTCLEAGAAGVAGISSIMAAPSPGQKVEEWKKVMGEL